MSSWAYITLCLSLMGSVTLATATPPDPQCYANCTSILSRFPELPSTPLCQTICQPEGQACAAAVVDWMDNETWKAYQALAASENVLAYIPLLKSALNRSMAEPSTGVGMQLSSDFRWTGHYDRCVKIPGAYQCTTNVQLNVAPTPTTIGAIAFCVPDSCSPSTIAELFQETIPSIPPVNVTFPTVCGNQTYGWEPGTYVMVVLSIVLALIALLAAVIEFFSEADKPPALWREMLDCFSPRRNYEGFCSLRDVATNSLDGMRTISMSWVVLGHTLIWPLQDGAQGFTNIEEIIPVAQTAYQPHSADAALMATWTGQVVQSAEFAVDTFFYMSGFLAVYIGMKKLAKLSPVGVLKGAPFMYLDRWLRLTPLYMFVVWLYVKVVPTMESGPSWKIPDKGICEEYWWQNILYIQTIFMSLKIGGPNTGGCYGVSWYLADDMMFFYLVPIIIAFALIGSWVAFTFIGTAGAASLLYTLTKSIQRDWRAATFDASDYQLKYYMPPWTRCPPYLMGAAFGLIWYRWSAQITTSLTKRIYLRIGLLVGSAFLLLSTVYGLAGGADSIPSSTSQGAMSLYVAFSKPAWTLGLILLNALCFSRQGSAIQWVLERKIFGYLGKLSYGMYLCHPIILVLIFNGQPIPEHYSIVNFSRNYIAALSITTAVAFVVHIFVELPCGNLVQLLMTVVRTAKPAPAQQQGSKDMEAGLMESKEMPNSPNFPGCESRRETQESVVSFGTQDPLLSVDGVDEYSEIKHPQS